MIAFLAPFVGWIGGVFAIIYIAIKKFITPAIALSMQITAATFIITVSLLVLKYGVDFLLLAYNTVNDLLLLLDNIPTNEKISQIEYFMNRLGIIEIYNFAMSLFIDLIFTIVVIKLLSVIRATSILISDQFWRIGMLLK